MSARLKNIVLFLILWGLISSSLVTLAAEVDQFTDRAQLLSDESSQINAVVNQYLDLSLEEANKQGKCDPTTLYTNLRKHFNIRGRSEIISKLLTDPTLSKRSFSYAQSIYRDFPFLVAPEINFHIVFSHEPIWSVVNFGGHEVGSDKFEHLFFNGFEYFENYYQKHLPLFVVLGIGALTEQSIYGLLTTGMLSYGDLSANFAGLRFWNNILGQYQDILTPETKIGPYVVCRQGQWQKNQKIDLGVYIDGSWDEAINCNKFRNQDILQKTLDRMHEINPTYACPLDNNKLQPLVDQYGSFSKWIINSEGMQTIEKSPYFR